MIITITGSGSGAGKTATAGELLKQGNFCMVLSHTTRLARPDDLPGEYKCITEEEFMRMKDNGEFAWTTPHFRGRNYGTAKKALAEALNDATGKIFIMILVPETLPLLIKNLPGPNLVMSLFITAKPETVQRRLKNKGWSDEKINQRFSDERDWEGELKKTRLPYITISNDGTLEETVANIRKILGSF